MFSNCFTILVLNFELSERQQIYSSLPKSVLEDALNDENRVANIAINEHKRHAQVYHILHVDNIDEVRRILLHLHFH
jgi:hypothetical protein